MATKTAEQPKRRKAAARQRRIDATRYVESRRTWDPDEAEMEAKLARINRTYLKLYGKLK